MNYICLPVSDIRQKLEWNLYPFTSDSGTVTDIEIQANTQARRRTKR